MITDKVISVVFQLLQGLVEGLPEPGNPPAFLTQTDGVWATMGGLLPMGDIVTLLGVVVTAFGGLYIWRAIRMFTPGG